jgi:hypothetical protein
MLAGTSETGISRSLSSLSQAFNSDNEERMKIEDK